MQKLIIILFLVLILNILIIVEKIENPKLQLNWSKVKDEIL